MWLTVRARLIISAAKLQITLVNSIFEAPISISEGLELY